MIKNDIRWLYKTMFEIGNVGLNETYSITTSIISAYILRRKLLSIKAKIKETKLQTELDEIYGRRRY